MPASYGDYSEQDNAHMVADSRCTRPMLGRALSTSLINELVV